MLSNNLPCCFENGVKIVKDDKQQINTLFVLFHSKPWKREVTYFNMHSYKLRNDHNYDNYHPRLWSSNIGISKPLAFLTKVFSYNFINCKWYGDITVTNK